MAFILDLFRRTYPTSAYEVEQRKRTLKVILWVIFVGGDILAITNFLYGFMRAGSTVLILCAACLVAIRLNEADRFTAAAGIVGSLLFLVVVYDIVDAGGIVTFDLLQVPLRISQNQP